MSRDAALSAEEADQKRTASILARIQSKAGGKITRSEMATRLDQLGVTGSLDNAMQPLVDAGYVSQVKKFGTGSFTIEQAGIAFLGEMQTLFGSEIQEAKAAHKVKKKAAGKTSDHELSHIDDEAFRKDLTPHAQAVFDKIRAREKGIE